MVVMIPSDSSEAIGVRPIVDFAAAESLRIPFPRLRQI